MYGRGQPLYMTGSRPVRPPPCQPVENTRAATCPTLGTADAMGVRHGSRVGGAGARRDRHEQVDRRRWCRARSVGSCRVRVQPPGAVALRVRRPGAAQTAPAGSERRRRRRRSRCLDPRARRAVPRLARARGTATRDGGEQPGPPAHHPPSGGGRAVSAVRSLLRAADVCARWRGHAVCYQRWRDPPCSGSRRGLDRVGGPL
jgi:hypothetical protein